MPEKIWNSICIYFGNLETETCMNGEQWFNVISISCCIVSFKLCLWYDGVKWDAAYVLCVGGCWADQDWCGSHDVSQGPGSLLLPCTRQTLLQQLILHGQYKSTVQQVCAYEQCQCGDQVCVNAYVPTLEHRWVKSVRTVQHDVSPSSSQFQT